MNSGKRLLLVGFAVVLSGQQGDGCGGEDLGNLGPRWSPGTCRSPVFDVTPGGTVIEKKDVCLKVRINTKGNDEAIKTCVYDPAPWSFSNTQPSNFRISGLPWYLSHEFIQRRGPGEPAGIICPTDPMLSTPDIGLRLHFTLHPNAPLTDVSGNPLVIVAQYEYEFDYPDAAFFEPRVGTGTFTFRIAADPSRRTLNVIPPQNGIVESDSAPFPIRCSAADVGSPTSLCARSFPTAQHVSLTARPTLTGWKFSSFTGDCASLPTSEVGQSVGVSVVMNDHMTCGATFEPDANALPLTVSTVGNGTILINSTVCSSICVPRFPRGERVTLLAQPAAGWSFDSWSGDCAGQGASASVDMLVERSCEATFKPDAAPAELTITIVGQGNVSGAGGTIACSTGNIGSCRVATDIGELIRLEATANTEEGHRFTGWSGACAGATPNISLTVNSQTMSCTANFARTSDPCMGITSLPQPIVTAQRLMDGMGSTVPLLPNGRLLRGDTLVLSVENLSAFPAGAAINRWEVTGQWGTTVRATGISPQEVRMMGNFVVCERISVALVTEACSLSEAATVVEYRVLPPSGDEGVCP